MPETIKFAGAKYRLSMFGTPQPPGLVGKCPRCLGALCLAFVNQIDRCGNHIYRCSRCSATVGAPTDFARCQIYGLLSKDCFWSPCTKCPHRRSVPGHGVCVHFEGPVNYAEVS